MLYKSMFNNIKRLFLKGFFTLLPLTVTFWVLKFLYNTSIRILAPLRAIEPWWMQNIPGSEIVIIFFFFLFIGLLGQFFIITPFMLYVEKIVTKIPLARIVYASVKTMGDFFDASGHPELKRKVVLIQYPAEGVYKIAFLLGETEDIKRLIHKKNDEKIMKVFMPTSHITTGFMIFVPESHIISTNISFEDAVKMMISCGVIHPNNIGPSNDKEA
ncbi:DUF502 domain-containing protein [Candidatus Babeliales bacterium]|nr:DUF502 domain-containing protein [Candidatus Babeliales bacterium]